MEHLPWLSLIGVVFAVFLWLRGRTVETLEPPSSTSGPQTMSDEAVAELVRQGRKIEAVKMYRKVHSVGLKEALEAVEELARRNP